MSSGTSSSGSGGGGAATNTSSSSTTNMNNNNNNIRSGALFDDKADFALVKWLASFEPHNLPDSLSNAFRLGPLQDKLKITKPIVWLANLSCDFKSAYAVIDDPHDAFGHLGGRRRASDGKRTYPRPFKPAEKKRFESLQDEYHNQRWQNLLLLGYDPATAATMVGALRDKQNRVFSPPPLFALSPRMIVTDEEKRMKMKATVMGYLDGLAKQAEKELLEDLDREIAEEQGNNNGKGGSKSTKKKAKKKAAAVKKKSSDATLGSTVDSSPQLQDTISPAAAAAAAAAATTNNKTETVEEKRRRIEFAVAEARRKQNEAEQLKLQQQQQQNNAQQNDDAPKRMEGTRPSSPGPLSPDQMKYLHEQKQKAKPSMLENYNERDRKIIREALERTGLNEEDVTKDVTSTTKKGKGMPYAWCCDFCKTATFPTFAEAALHETTCEERPKTAEELEAVTKASLEKKEKFFGPGGYGNGLDNKSANNGSSNNTSVVGDGSSNTSPSNSKAGADEGNKSKQSTDSISGKKIVALKKTSRSGYALAKECLEAVQAGEESSGKPNVAELVDSLAIEWSEKKEAEKNEVVDRDEPSSSKESPSNNSEKKATADENRVTTSSPVIPSVDYSDDESDSDDDFNLEQLVGRNKAAAAASSRTTPVKKAPVAAPKIVELSNPPPTPSEKSVKQQVDKEKALSKKEKKKAAAAAKKEKKKAEKAAAAAAATTTTSSSRAKDDNNSTIIKQQKKVAVEKPVPVKESTTPQSKQRVTTATTAFRKSPIPETNQPNNNQSRASQIAQVMKSSTIDYGDRVNDTALPHPPGIRQQSPIVAQSSLEQSSDLFILQESSSSTAPPHVSPPPNIQVPQSQLMSNNTTPIRSPSASQAISPSVVSRLSTLTAENEVLIAKNNFLESDNQSLRAEVEALRNQMAMERQSAVEALQRVQLKSYIADTARDAAEERATWLEAVLVDAVAEMTTREVVRAETNEAIKAVSYSVVQERAIASLEPPPSFNMQQQMQSPPMSVLPPSDLGDHSPLDQGSSSNRPANAPNSFSFEGDLNLGQLSSLGSGGILPQAPWTRDEGVFARLRRGDDA